MADYKNDIFAVYNINPRYRYANENHLKPEVVVFTLYVTTNLPIYPLCNVRSKSRPQCQQDSFTWWHPSVEVNSTFHENFVLQYWWFDLARMYRYLSVFQRKNSRITQTPSRQKGFPLMLVELVIGTAHKGYVTDTFTGRVSDIQWI